MLRPASVAALAFVLCAAGTEPVRADGVQRLTLADAVRLALERNRGFLTTRENRRKQRRAFRDAEEDLWVPEISVSISPGVNRTTSKDISNNTATVTGRTGVTIKVPTGGSLALDWSETRALKAFPSRSRGLTFTQPLLRGVGPALSGFPLRKARITEQNNVMTLRDAAAGLIVKVVGEHRALSGAERQVEIAEAALRRAQDQLTATLALIEAGRTARREAVRFEATITNRELSLARARNARDAANLTLVGTLAFEETVRIRPTVSLTVERRKVAYEPVFRDALRLGTGFRMAQNAVELARIALAEARDKLLPDVNFTLTHKRDTDPNSSGRTTTPTVTTLGVGTTIQLNDRMTRRALEDARLALRQAERSLTERRESIGIAVRRAVNNVTVQLRLIDLARGARALAESNLEIEKRKFNEGLVSSFEVAASEDSLLQAEQAEVNAIVTYLGALTQLDQVSGRTLERWGVRLEERPAGPPDRQGDRPETGTR